MTSRKKIYKAGDWFAVPLENNGYAIGRLARIARGGILLGYFFGPRLAKLPDQYPLDGLSRKDAILIAMFGDIGLQSGVWPLLKPSEKWMSDEWPVPEFVHHDDVDTLKYRLRKYDEKELDIISEKLINPEDAYKYPKDGFHGHLSLIYVLSKML